jgi:hypothetical protein
MDVSEGVITGEVAPEVEVDDDGMPVKSDDRGDDECE